MEYVFKLKVNMTKHFYVMWNDSGKPYEFLYDSYGKANQMAHNLIRRNFEPMIVIRFVKD